MNHWYLHDIYTMSTCICLHYVYMISTLCLHIWSTWYLHYVIVRNWLTGLFTYLITVSAAVPWRAVCLNIVCMSDSDLPWCTVCHYFVFCNVTAFIFGFHFFRKRVCCIMQKLHHQIVPEFNVWDVSPPWAVSCLFTLAQQVISWLDTFAHSLSIVHCHGGWCSLCCVRESRRPRQCKWHKRLHVMHLRWTLLL